MTGLQATVVTVSCLWLVMLAYITTGESLGIVYSSCISHSGLGVTFMNSTVSVKKCYCLSTTTWTMKEWLRHIKGTLFFFSEELFSNESVGPCSPNIHFSSYPIPAKI